MLAAAGGYAGTKVMERVSSWLYELGPEEDRRREEKIRPGPPYRIAADKTLGLLGTSPQGRASTGPPGTITGSAVSGGGPPGDQFWRFRRADILSRQSR